MILLLATTTTGLTVRRSLECVQYYGGTVHGISSIFSTVKKVGGMEVHSVFNADDVPGLFRRLAEMNVRIAKKVCD